MCLSVMGITFACGLPPRNPRFEKRETWGTRRCQRMRETPNQRRMRTPVEIVDPTIAPPSSACLVIWERITKRRIT